MIEYNIFERMWKNIYNIFYIFEYIYVIYLIEYNIFEWISKYNMYLYNSYFSCRKARNVSKMLVILKKKSSNTILYVKSVLFFKINLWLWVKINYGKMVGWNPSQVMNIVSRTTPTWRSLTRAILKWELSWWKFS